MTIARGTVSVMSSSVEMDQILEGVETFARQVARLLEDVNAHKVSVPKALDVIDGLVERFRSEQKTMAGRRGELLDPIIGFCQVARATVQRMTS